MEKDFLANKPFWIRQPEKFAIGSDGVEIITQPYTDLWQRTYYGFCNDNAPVLQIKTAERYFSFEVKTAFDGKRRFDQCGVALYLNGENWLKASVEYENDLIQRLGSVVTNDGFSDWATTDISSSVHELYYRLSRRESDYCIESSLDGKEYKQMRICHLTRGAGEIAFGIYACGPENSSFRARFTQMRVTECKWKEHK